MRRDSILDDDDDSRVRIVVPRGVGRQGWDAGQITSLNQLKQVIGESAFLHIKRFDGFVHGGDVCGFNRAFLSFGCVVEIISRSGGCAGFVGR